MAVRLRYIFPRPLVWVLVVAAVNLLLKGLIDGPFWGGDTWSYINAIPNILYNGYDLYRTPLYPMFLWVCSLLVGDKFLYLAVAVQCVVYLVSIVALWHTMAGVSSSRRVATAICAFYAVAPAFALYLIAFLTDAPAVMLSVFLLFFAWRVARRGAGWGTCAGFALVLMLMLELRPSLASMLPAVAVLVVWVIYNKYRRAWLLAALCAAAMLPMGVQVGLMWRHTGVPTPSQVGVDNMWAITVIEGTLSTDFTDNPELASRIDSAYYFISKPGGMDAYGPWVMNLGHQSVKDYGLREVGDVVRQAGAPWCGLDHRIIDSATRYHMIMDDETLGFNQYFQQHAPYSEAVNRWLFPWLKFWLIYVAMAVAGVAIVVAWRRHRRMPALAVFAWLMEAGMVASSLLYAPNHFDRLALPGLPGLMLLAAWMWPAARRRAVMIWRKVFPLR